MIVATANNEPSKFMVASRTVSLIGIVELGANESERLGLDQTEIDL